MNYDLKRAEELLKVTERRRKAKRMVLRSEEGKVLLEWMKEFFQTDLPCFQGEKGGFDPLDAMRRDAYKEVVLWLERMPEENNGEEGEEL
mgnify:CR=1 FL=1|nr:MAG TPA_asm: hypothetical protein [Caudoviricetes sp.]